MSLRLEFVGLAGHPEANVRELCRQWKISPTTAYKWLDRHRSGGTEALADRPRRPRQSPRQTARELEAVVVALRREQLPAASTITGILHRHGLIAPAASRSRQATQRFERPGPNQLWQMDFKGHFAMASGRCHPLTVLDDHSRFNLVLEACADERETTVQRALIAAFERYGLPAAILCDNGPPWGGTGTEHTALSVWLLRLGVGVCHGRAYHPQTQGKEERFHRTLLTEVIQRGGWSGCPHVQKGFDDWRPVYNCERPHEALDLATPVSRYRPSQRPYPSQLPAMEYAPEVDVRQVDCTGHISYRSRPWKVGRGFIGQPVGVRPTAVDGVREIIFATRVIKTIDLRLNTNP
jgi:transposase InsO family protein